MMKNKEDSTCKKEQSIRKKEVKKAFKIIPQNMNSRDGINFDNIGELLEKVGGVNHK